MLLRAHYKPRPSALPLPPGYSQCERLSCNRYSRGTANALPSLRQEAAITLRFARDLQSEDRGNRHRVHSAGVECARRRTMRIRPSGDSGRPAAGHCSPDSAGGPAACHPWASRRRAGRGSCPCACSGPSRGSRTGWRSCRRSPRR